MASRCKIVGGLLLLPGAFSVLRHNATTDNHHRLDIAIMTMSNMLALNERSVSV